MPKNEKGGVIVAIDLDNLLISSAEAGQKFKDYSTEAGFHNIFNWIFEFGKILCVHMYLSCGTYQYLNDTIWHNLWKRYEKKFLFECIYCPRIIFEGKLQDNVDNHLISHTMKMAGIFADKAKYFCLGSGDKGYTALLWDLKNMDMEIAFAVGSERSFARSYKRLKIAGKHPETGKELIHYFSPYKK